MDHSHFRGHVGAAVIDSTMDAVICLDQSHNICLLNATAEKLFGYAESWLMGHPLDVLIPHELRELHAQHIKQFETTKRSSRRMGHLGILQAVHASGRHFPIEATISIATYNEQTVLTVLVRDVSEQVQMRMKLESAIGELSNANNKLQEMAQMDYLTRLPNRLLLFDRLRNALAQRVQGHTFVCVLYIDLDGFKTINDVHGHDAGDTVLVQLSTQMRRELREGDTFARVGGDEFVALLMGVESIMHCLPTVDRLIGAASQAIQMGEKTVQVSASIGVTSSYFSNSAEELIRQADMAMYHAKRKGKNRYEVFSANEMKIPT